MRIAIIAASAALFALLPAAGSFAAEVPTAEQCAAWFTKADTNGDGSLGKNEDSVKLGDMITKSSTGTAMGSDGIIAKDLFLSECEKGTFGMPSS